MTIPKIIHQTWKDQNIPEQWKNSPIEWKKNHPDWEYKLWTDEDNLNLIKSKYPEYLDLYQSWSYQIQRVDMVRYFILKEYGGIYCDLDMYPNENLEKYFFNNTNEVYFVKGWKGVYFTNSFMASQKEAPFWNFLIKRIKNQTNWWILGKHLQVMNTTGPMFVDKCIADYPGIIGYLPKKIFNNFDLADITIPGSIVVTPGNSWHSWDSTLFNFIYKYRVVFIVIGLSFLIIFIFLVIYLILKYLYIKNILEHCLID